MQFKNHKNLGTQNTPSNQQKEIPKAHKQAKNSNKERPPPKLLEENGKLKEKIIGFSIILSIVLYSLLIHITLDLYGSAEQSSLKNSADTDLRHLKTLLWHTATFDFSYSLRFTRQKSQVFLFLITETSTAFTFGYGNSCLEEKKTQQPNLSSVGILCRLEPI